VAYRAGVRTHGRKGRGLALVAVGLAAIALRPSPAAALPADQFGVFPTWTTSGTSGAFSASAAFAPSAGFPSVTVATNSTTIRAPSGESAWLAAATGFGQEYGSSRAQPYLQLATAPGTTPSTTTLTFGAPPPLGWGFALGDVDADWVFITAWQDAARTVPLTVDQLGFEAAGNYCTGSPRPSSCATGPFTDAPVWVTTPEVFDGVSYVPGTLRGNSLPGAPATGRDTAGAYGWFRPTVAVATMDLLFGPRDGLPSVQLWLAGAAPKATITGTVELPELPPGSEVPPGTTITLNDADGEPVLGIDEQPVTVPVEPDGTYTIETEQRDEYEIAVHPPPGFEVPAPIEVPATVAEVVAPPIVLLPVEPDVPVVPAVPVVPVQPAPSSTVPAGTDPSLPATGIDALVLVVVAAGLVATGCASVAAQARRGPPPATREGL
jgi:hypothetical protein